MSSPYRNLPAVNTLVQDAERLINGTALPHSILVEAARSVLEQARAIIAQGGDIQHTTLAEQTITQAQVSLNPSLRSLINATGVIIQTNLGRAPLSDAALAAMRAIGEGYSNLEYDLDAGDRGSRYNHLTSLLCRLTGAETALAVNNNAAAIYLVLSAFAAGREVIISRGQAVEIGGGFRIPDVLRQSGATLVEVGTTNRTYARDYAGAITGHTALLLRVHTSNFRLTGFVHETSLADMVAVGHEHGLPVLDDLGSGTLLQTAAYGLAPEPTVQESIAAGADLVTFSGDKLLGGPQAGLIAGKAALVARLKQHPLARALRVDKTTIAALEATLLAYVRGRATQEIPVWQMISASQAELQARAAQVVTAIGSTQAHIIESVSTIGGGSLPGETLASVAVAIDHPQPDLLVRRLRLGVPPVVARIVNDRVVCDLRTLLPGQEMLLATAVRTALQWEE